MKIITAIILIISIAGIIHSVYEIGKCDGKLEMLEHKNEALKDLREKIEQIKKEEEMQE